MQTLTNPQAPPQMVAIAVSTSGDNVLVAADPSGRQICIYKFQLYGAGAVGASFKSGGAAITGNLPLAAAGSNIGGTFDGLPHFKGGPGQNLVLNLSGSVAVTGYMTYSLE